MRVGEIKKLFEELENIEAETKRMIEIIMQGARERFIVYALTNNRTLARTEINYKDETDEFECNFEDFKKNVIDEIKKMADEQREKERDLQQYSRELEEKQKKELFISKKELFISKMMGCIGKFEEVFRFMRELEKRFSIRFNVEKDMGIAKVRIEAIRIATGEIIDAFEYHIVEPDRIQSDMEDLEKKLIEIDLTVKAKEVVKFLDDYARSKGWNCYFGNLEVCKSSEILRAVLMSHKEKHPRFVSFYLGNSIETIKKQIEGIRLI